MKTLSWRHLVKSLAVNPTRAKLIAKMCERLLVSSSEELLDELWTWRTKTGKSLAPTTMFGYLTAIKVASQLVPNRLIGGLVFRRHIRRCKKALALHERKRAIPLKFRDLQQILSDATINPATRRAILLCWGLALRLGNLEKIKNKDIKFIGKDLIRIRVRAMKGADLGLSNKYRFLHLSGIFAPLKRLFQQALDLDPDLPLLAISRQQMVYALKGYDKSLASHSVRRGAAQHLASKGISMSRIQQVLDHKTVLMTEIYINPCVRQPHVRRALASARCLSRV